MLLKLFIKGVLGKRKRISKLTGRIAQAIEVNEAAAPTPREVQNNHINDEEEQINTDNFTEGNQLPPNSPYLKNTSLAQLVESLITFFRSMHYIL